MNNKFVRLNELARHTHLPAAWLRREAKAGRIPCIRAGRMLRFDVAEVVKSLAERQAAEVSRG
ncbi:MAG: helix-turn-helix transcriptional regulator [Phycisphaerales bacterium]